MKSRIFEVVQQTEFLNEDQIKIGLSHKIIEHYAYILHDKDKNDDGTPKALHWHIVLKLKKDYELTSIANWFKVAPQYVEVKKGYGAFLDCVKYLTHEDEKQQEKGKYLYPDDCVKASFPFRVELEKLKAREIKRLKNHPSDTVDKWCYGLLMEGKSLLDCVNEDPILYSKYMSRLSRCRADYLSRQKPPQSRVNIYISGRAGAGKGLASKAIARQFARTIDNFENAEDSALFFEVGAEGSNFEGYDGQPVIIWNDCRSYELFKKLGTRETIYNVFETHPTAQRQNIKYSSVRLLNKINIINSVQSPDDFIKGLAGEYIDKQGQKHEAEDINQVRRRIVITMELHRDFFEAQFNKGYFEDNDDYGEYYDYKKMTGNFGKIRKALSSKQAEQTEALLTEPINKKIIDKFEQEENKTDLNELPEEFKNYGKPWVEDEMMYIPDGINASE